MNIYVDLGNDFDNWWMINKHALMQDENVGIREVALAAWNAALSTSKSAPDPLLPEAKALSMDLGKVSVSFLQRRMRIGYTRAARLADYMIADGFCEAERVGEESFFRLIKKEG